MNFVAVWGCMDTQKLYGLHLQYRFFLQKSKIIGKQLVHFLYSVHSKRIMRMHIDKLTVTK